MKTLLLGMGNPILCDDAVGIRLAKEFKERFGQIPVSTSSKSVLWEGSTSSIFSRVTTA